MLGLFIRVWKHFFCLDRTWLNDAWLRPMLAEPLAGGGAARRGSLCALSRVKRTKAGVRGSGCCSAGYRVLPPRHTGKTICMWNRHFTPPHSLIVGKIICEIALHQECFLRQLSHHFLCTAGPQSWHASSYFLYSCEMVASSIITLKQLLSNAMRTALVGRQPVVIHFGRYKL